MADPSPTHLSSIRRQLAGAPPHVSVKVALRELIVALRRASAARSGARHALASRRGLDRVLNQEVQVDPTELVQLKSDLRRLVDARDPDLAWSIADRLVAWVPRVLPEDTQVTVQLAGRPPQLSDETAHALLGSVDGTSTAAAAALAKHRLHGLCVGGATLQVDVALPPGTCLPAVPRSERADRGRWGRAEPWLRALDAEGRHSLTPEAVAHRVAARAPSVDGRVLDACCGCGGSAIAFAEAGHRVLAVELDPHRAELARENARCRGVSERVEVRTASVESLLDSELAAADLLYVDPPWSRGELRATDFSRLMAPFPRLAAAIASAPVVVLKLPRVFDVESLPGGAAAWDLFYELGTAETGDAQVVRMITAQRPRGCQQAPEIPKGPDTR